MTEKYKVGVIGAGVWGCHSLERELLSTGLCEIKSVCGRDDFGAGIYDNAVAGANEYARELKAEFVSLPEDIINDPEIDIISVMCAPSVKAQWLIKALRNNKYVVTDKPLSLTVEEAKAVCNAEESSKAHGFMLGGYHIRPAVARLLELISQGKLGETKAISIRLNFFRGIYPSFKPSKRWRSEISGGESVTIGSHGLITAMKLAGTPIEEGRYIRKYNFYDEYRVVEADDYAIYNLKFSGGAVSNISVGRLPYYIPEEDIVIELTGTEGYAQISGTRLEVYPGKEIFDGKFNVPELLREVFTQFVHSISNKNVQPLTSFRDGLAVQKILSDL